MHMPADAVDAGQLDEFGASLHAARAAMFERRCYIRYVTPHALLLRRAGEREEHICAAALLLMPSGAMI